MNLLPPIFGGLLALLCLIAATAARRKRRLINALPTSKCQGVYIGFVELNGVAEHPRPLTSALAEISCVAFSASVEVKLAA
jgi:hypothetical protein